MKIQANPFTPDTQAKQERELLKFQTLTRVWRKALVLSATLIHCQLSLTLTAVWPRLILNSFQLNGHMPEFHTDLQVQTTLNDSRSDYGSETGKLHYYCSISQVQNTSLNSTNKLVIPLFS